MNAERIRAGILGVLVADALGVPHEFKAARAIPTRLAMTMPEDYPKTYARVPYGTWSDDGATTLALADSLATCDRFDAADFRARLCRWYQRGEYTPDGVVFDIGNTTRAALDRGAGLTSEDSNGNGSLMRTLPIALFFESATESDMFKDACDASAVTHDHVVSRVACGVYCLAARYLLAGRDPLDAFITIADLPALPRGSGFVLDSLSFAAQALRMPSYEAAVTAAIRLGGDTDTNAAIAGGVIAVRDGMDAIPRAWLNELRGRDLAESIIERFIVAAT